MQPWRPSRRSREDRREKKRGRDGDFVNFEHPVREPLLGPARIYVDEFMWMGEIELDSTLARVQATYALLPIDPEVASCFARIASVELSRGRRLRRHDTWIAATALRHGAAIVTQDSDFSSFDEVPVIRA
jgi:predicted nucleic acid-binding protein